MQAETGNKPVKIALIGAGSAEFSMSVVRDVCLMPGFAGSELCFMDIDLDRLDAIDRLARRYAAELSVDLQLTKTLDREEALRDADFIINTAAPLSHHDEEVQRAIFDRHGYYRGVRVPYFNIELMLDVARDIVRICPDAWLLQSGNPVFEGCTLMTRETGVKAIGLCHGRFGVKKIARALGLNEEDVAFEAPGVNHCIWMTKFRYRGEDAYPLIDAWIENEAETHWAKPVERFGDTQMSRASVDMYRMFGYFPIGDTPRFGGSQFISSWWYHTDLRTKQEWYGSLGGFDSEIGWSQYLDWLNDNLSRLLKTAYDENASVTDIFPPTLSGEQIVPIIDALAHDRPGLYQVNVPNHGAIAGIGDDVVVELPAMVSGSGVQPLRIDPLPRHLLTRVLTPKILEMEMNLEVFQSGDPTVWFHQLMFDHRTRSPEQAIAAMQEVLDQPFNARMRERFGELDALRACFAEEAMAE